MSVIAFDTDVPPDVRDAEMGQRLATARQKDPQALLLVVTGGVHASREPEAAFVPMAVHFGKLTPPHHIVSLAMKHSGGQAWVCTDNCGPLAACPWDLDTTCPPELQQIVDNKQVGCRSAGQVCAIDPNNPTLACAATNDLYGCVGGGPNNVIGSCYSNNAAPTCCGCPSWSPNGECNNNNPKWQLPSAPEKYAKVFKDACPTAYSFPYDDPTSTFTCQGRPDKNVDYDITFCP